VAVCRIVLGFNGIVDCSGTVVLSQTDQSFDRLLRGVGARPVLVQPTAAPISLHWSQLEVLTEPTKTPRVQDNSNRIPCSDHRLTSEPFHACHAIPGKTSLSLFLVGWVLGYLKVLFGFRRILDRNTALCAKNQKVRNEQEDYLVHQSLGRCTLAIRACVVSRAASM
jgi:hypothetical protein